MAVKAIEQGCQLSEKGKRETLDLTVHARGACTRKKKSGFGAFFGRFLPGFPHFSSSKAIETSSLQTRPVLTPNTKHIKLTIIIITHPIYTLAARILNVY